MTVRSSSWRRSAAGLLAIGALAVGGLSGCSGRPGAAAVVDGDEISVRELQSATSDLGPYLDNVSQTSVLMVLVVAPTFERAAVKAGVGVSDQQAEDLLDQAAAAATEAGTVPPRTTAFSDSAIEVAKFTLVQTNLQALPDAGLVSAQVTEQLDALDATINPRYGTVDFTSGSIMPPSYPWLVATTPAG